MAGIRAMLASKQAPSVPLESLAQALPTLQPDLDLSDALAELPVESLKNVDS